MKFDLTIVGFGVIGTESLHKLSQSIKKDKNFKIAIIEKDLNKIPGGIAYNQIDSKYGYFNNPLRLSNTEFIRWIKNRKNINKLILFIQNNKNYNLNTWLINNKLLNLSVKKFDEIYFPRLTYSFFLQEKIKKIFNIISKKNLIIKFFEGELDKISSTTKNKCLTKRNLSEYRIHIGHDNIKFKLISNKKTKSILSKNIIIGNGLLPPKIIDRSSNKKNFNYIWDFYSEGGTSNLIKKIKKLSLKKNKIKIIFIGNKAGLLEAMPEMENFIEKFKKNICIYTIAPRSLTLQKAEKSQKFNSFKFKYLVYENINKIKKSSEILKLIKKEFSHSIKKGFFKYDVWTWILKKDLLSMCYNKLSIDQRSIYNDITFPLIRNITRYTYPNTVNSKNRLVKNKILKYVQDKVVFLNFKKDQIQMTTKKNLKISADIVVNVSGPVSIKNLKNETNYINSLKKISKNYNDRGFLVDKNFMFKNNIYMPGMIASNFNPNRLTIIKAITSNAHKSIDKILANV